MTLPGLILRVDDIHTATEPADLIRLYGPVWARGGAVCFSVIPQAAYRFDAGGIAPTPPVDLNANRALCEFLVAQVRAGRAEIALHGWRHTPGELTAGSPAGLRARLAAGLAALRSALPGVPVRVLVPPHDALARAGWAAARALGLGVCSTWAATHGGTRLAHWVGRARRWCGWPAAPARGGRWPTDITLLDFAGPAAADAPLTARWLRWAARWRSPLVLTQHYWRVPAEGDVALRWQRWLDEWVAAATFVTYHPSFADLG